MHKQWQNGSLSNLMYGDHKESTKCVCKLGEGGARTLNYSVAICN